MCGVESAIRSTQPFSKEERLNLQQKKLEEHLRTSTGIPKVDVDEYEKKKKEKHYFNTHSPLPPLKNKPQVDLFYTFEKIYVFFWLTMLFGKKLEKIFLFFFLIDLLLRTEIIIFVQKDSISFFFSGTFSFTRGSC